MAPLRRKFIDLFALPCLQPYKNDKSDKSSKLHLLYLERDSIDDFDR